MCLVKTAMMNSFLFHLFAAVMSQTQEEPSKPTERERIGLYMAVGLLAVVIVCLFLGNIITFCNFTRLIPVEISCLRDNLSQKN